MRENQRADSCHMPINDYKLVFITLHCAPNKIVKRLKFLFRLLPHAFQGLSCLLPVQPYWVRLPPAGLLPLIIRWHHLHAASVISLWATILCSRLSKSFWLLIQILIWVSVPPQETDAIFYPDLHIMFPRRPRRTAHSSLF